MSSGFVTEAEVAEARKVRQEEWDRVRKPDDPLERPEEPYDARCLYDRLQEQKQKKDLEFEEAHKLKNMIKGLDDDEIEFLDLVDRTKIAADRRKEIEEEIELTDYRNRVATLQEKNLEERLQAEVAVNKPKSTSNRSSQQKLLKGIVLKTNESQKRKLSDSGNESNGSGEGDKRSKTDDANNSEISSGNNVGSAEVTSDSGLRCVAILPGLGCYNETTSDEDSSESEVEETSSQKIDLLGRKIDVLGRAVVDKTK